jgi:hypothetical protein
VELRKPNFEGPQSQFRNFFSPQFRNRFGFPQYCGIAEVRTKIADTYLCKSDLFIADQKQALEILRLSKPNLAASISSLLQVSA